MLQNKSSLSEQTILDFGQMCYSYDTVAVWYQHKLFLFNLVLSFLLNLCIILTFLPRIHSYIYICTYNFRRRVSSITFSFLLNLKIIKEVLNSKPSAIQLLICVIMGSMTNIYVSWQNLINVYAFPKKAFCDCHCLSKSTSNVLSELQVLLAVFDRYH